MLGYIHILHAEYKPGEKDYRLLWSPAITSPDKWSVVSGDESVFSLIIKL